MRIKVISILAFCMAAFTLEAMDWPAPDARLIRNFGWNDRGRPVLGAVFEDTDSVRAAESGELIFYRSANNTAGRLPSPLGAWCAIDHRDGLISIYSRLETKAKAPPQKSERGAPIAVSGVSGWAVNSGFYFMVYDRHERRWVNPSMIIRALPDTRPPQITAVELCNAQGIAVGTANLRSVAQGTYTILVTAYDTMQSPLDPLMAPHRIICSVNGAEVGLLNFETISARGGQLMVNRGSFVPARHIYAAFPAFEAGEALLSSGRVNLEVIVQDIAGNSSSSLLRLQVE
jgi:hypothetical protein